MLGWIIGFSLLGGLGGILGASVVLVMPERIRERVIPALLAFAVGVLLATALLGLLPDAVDRVEGPAALRKVMSAMLGGFVGIFALEKLILWRHSHEEDGHTHHTAHTVGPLVIAGDAVHNFVDGVVIAAAFAGSIPLGVATSLAVMAHELPHEVSDFAVLLEAGYSRGRALFFNMLSGVATLVGATVAYFALEAVTLVLPYALAVSAASFIYIAIAALTPVLHRKQGVAVGVVQLVLVGAGIATFLLIHEVTFLVLNA